jgi:hypothetical protein
MGRRVDAGAAATFIWAAEAEFGTVNADGFWESFNVSVNPEDGRFRLTAHRKSDPFDKGYFEQYADIDPALIEATVDEKQYLVIAVSAQNAVHALNMYRNTDWDADLQQRQARGPEAWEEE